MTAHSNTDALDTLGRRLVMETRTGNAASYRELLATFAPFVRRSAAGLLSRAGQTGMTEDVTQETLLALHLKLHTYDADMSFVAWVRAVTRHKVIDALRRNRMPTLSIDGPDFVEPADPANPEIPDVRRDVRTLLMRLKPPAGEVIYALKVEGVTVRELAAQHNTTEGAIKVMVHRGLQKLSAMVAEKKDS